jgi:hypothetical protein
MAKRLTEENYPHMNIPRMSTEGLSVDEIKRLVSLGQRFYPFSDEHHCAIWEQISIMMDENRKKSEERFERLKMEEPAYYAALQERIKEHETEMLKNETL